MLQEIEILKNVSFNSKSYLENSCDKHVIKIMNLRGRHDVRIQIFRTKFLGKCSTTREKK